MVKNNTKFKETELGPIPEEWEVLHVRDIGKVVTGKTPPTVHPEYYGDDFMFVKIPDMTGSMYIRKTESNLSEAGADYLSKAKLPKNSVMVSCIATVGNVGITTEESFTNQQINSVIPNEKVIDTQYLYYFFTQNKDYLHSLGGGGSVYTNISKSKFENMEIALPPLAEQKSISSILSSLDDKIELNRQINANLEKIASALFKRWFVDFEFPDKNGKPYKSSGGKMVESEMGEIPEGWRVGKLGEEFEIIMGQSPSGDTYNEEGKGVPFYQGRTDFGFRFPTRRVYCTGPTRMAMPLDTLVSVRAPVGDVNMASEDCCIGRGVGAVRKIGYSSYVFYTVKSLQDEIVQFDSEGTVFGSINKNSLSNITYILPKSDLISEFETIAGSIDDQIMNFTREVERLVDIRDLLLPRLMSGKIRCEAI